MAKYNIYAIGYGIDPKTRVPVFGLKVSTWKECESYVKGVEHARYKGFLSDTEADMWLDKVGNKPGPAIKPGPDIPDSSADINMQQTVEKDMSADEAKSNFVDICKSCNVNPQTMLDKLIMDFVNTYRFLYPEQPAQEEDENFGELPFN